MEAVARAISRVRREDLVRADGINEMKSLCALKWDPVFLLKNGRVFFFTNELERGRELKMAICGKELCDEYIAPFPKIEKDLIHIVVVDEKEPISICKKAGIFRLGWRFTFFGPRIEPFGLSDRLERLIEEGDPNFRNPRLILSVRAISEAEKKSWIQPGDRRIEGVGKSVEDDSFRFDDDLLICLLKDVSDARIGKEREQKKEFF
jgi:hypothetical protein